jgi:predicted phosphodiesterase
MLNRRKFLAATPIALSAALSPRLTAQHAMPNPPQVGRSSRSVRAEHSAVPRVKTASAKTARILQITDLHFFEKKDEDDRTIHDLHKLVDITNPDLVVATGDLWYENPAGQGFARMEFAVKQIDGLGVPWAFCWGNHDKLDDYQRGHDLLEQARNSAYRGALTHGDYRIELVSAREPTKPRVDLVCMNSSDIGLAEWQLTWFRTTSLELKSTGQAPRPAFAFFHIPILEYQTMFRHGLNTGLQLEKVCSEEESGLALPELARSRSLRACFCGHDHLNDYFVRTGDVDLVYGRATGHGGYGGDLLRKGAKMIEIDMASGEYEQATVFADGKTWRCHRQPTRRPG